MVSVVLSIRLRVWFMGHAFLESLGQGGGLTTTHPFGAQVRAGSSARQDSDLSKPPQHRPGLSHCGQYRFS
jgi:hypothetical protein